MKKKILLITETVPHYRVGLFNLLCHDYELTIAHGGNVSDAVEFSQIKIEVTSLGPLLYIQNLPDLCAFDVVIFTFNIRILNIFSLLFSRRNFKLLFFGIGVSASYKNRYDEKKMLDVVRKWIINKSDGIVFYEHYPITKYQALGIPSSKLHVAYNTVLRPTEFNFPDKKYERFIFLGSLYKAKKIYDLLEAYLIMSKTIEGDLPGLDLIGDGEERENIETWLMFHGLQDKIVLHGEVTNSSQLNSILNKAIACISPGQAGLSVQKCFSYGIPFITTKSAITGGELFSIINDVNGFLYEGTVHELADILKGIVENNSNVKEMSNNAYLFYNKFRTPEIWLNNFINAIEN